MTTADELIDEVIAEATASTGVTEWATALTADLTDVDTTLIVDSTDGFTSGLVEVDRELIYLKGLTDATHLSVLKRGWQSTTPAAHVAGTPVVRSPRFSRSNVLKLINRTLAGVWPTLYVVKSDRSNTVQTIKKWYGVPADAEIVLDVQIKSPATGQYMRANTWRLDATADPTQFPTGKAVWVPQGTPSMTIELTYAAQPTAIVTDLASASVPESWRGLLVAGALSSLAGSTEMIRSTINTVEQSNRAQTQQGGQGVNMANWYRREYLRQLDEQRKALLASHTPRKHRGARV